MKRSTSPYITLGQSRIHSKGVFAKKFIPAGAHVIEYVGEKVTKGESERRAEIPLNNNQKDKTKGAVYIFELNKRHDIDGNVPWNTAKYINHSCDPNCETDIIRGKIWIIALRDIQKGEEISYNYGYDFDDDYVDHRCLCRSTKCVGYILAEDFWPKLQKTILKKKDNRILKLDKAKRSSRNGRGNGHRNTHHNRSTSRTKTK